MAKIYGTKAPPNCESVENKPRRHQHAAVCRTRLTLAASRQEVADFVENEFPKKETRAFRRVAIIEECGNETTVDSYYIATGAWGNDCVSKLLDRFSGEVVEDDRYNLAAENGERHTICGHGDSKSADCDVPPQLQLKLKKEALKDLEERLYREHGV